LLHIFDTLQCYVNVMQRYPPKWRDLFMTLLVGCCHYLLEYLQVGTGMVFSWGSLNKSVYFKSAR